MPSQPTIQDQLDEIGGFAAGLQIVLTALTETLIDAKLIDAGTLFASIKLIADAAGEIGPGAIMAIDGFQQGIEASAGPNGHKASREFSALSERLRRLGGGRSSDEDAGS